MDKSSTVFHHRLSNILNAERRGVHLGISGDSVSELRAVRSIVCCLAEPCPQHVHAVVTAFTHGVLFFFRPAGIGVRKLGIAFGRNVRAFGGGVDSRFGGGKIRT